MTETTTQADVIEQLSETYGTFRSDYSGRGMFGATCIGIVTRRPDALIEEAAAQGVRGAKRDSMGCDYIVYWPKIKASDEATTEI